MPWPHPVDFSTTEADYETDMNLIPKPTYWVGAPEGAARRVRYAESFSKLRAIISLPGGEPNALDEMQREQVRLFLRDRIAAAK